MAYKTCTEEESIDECRLGGLIVSAAPPSGDAVW